MTKKADKACILNKLKKLFKFKPTVNVINLEGVIGSVSFKHGLTLSSLNKSIEEAFSGKNIKTVVLNINSPGGSPVQSELIGKRIVQLSQEKNIPVLAIVEDIAASGGYWIACAASEIIAAENALLGSLGVRFSGFGLHKAIERLGIERRIHTQGESKALLDPFLPEKPSDIEMILKVQADIYENFKKQVHNGRKDKLKLDDKEIFSGAIWSGRQAVEIGLADKIGDLYSEIKERFGEDIKITIVNQERSWLKRKLSLLFDCSAQSLLNDFQSKLELR
ncbi:MAG: S49 family peptidase [Pseudomonadota bacterium]